MFDVLSGCGGFGRRLRRWVLLPFAVGSITASAATPILEPQPTDPDEDYGESFTFIADLDDGTYVWTQFSFTHMGPGSHHGICRAVIVAPGMAPWSQSSRQGKSGWSYDPATQILKLGNCTARNGPKPEIRAVFDEGRVTLVFDKPLVHTWPPGTTVVRGNLRYRASLLALNGPVEVTINRPGQQKKLTGGGYADHSHSTWPPAKLGKAWVRFRALQKKPHTLIVGRQSPEGDFGPVYILEDGAEPGSFAEFDLKRTGEGSDTSWVATFDGAGRHATIRSTSLIYRSAPVQELGALLGRMLKSVVGSPVSYTHRAVLEREGQPPLEGLMEVSVDEG